MGRKKKSFIDKKQAETYHLVRRSQRDVGGYFDEETGEPLDIPKEFILLPDNPSHHRLKPTSSTASAAVGNAVGSGGDDGLQETNANEDALTRAKRQLHSAGLLDEYDYTQHMKPITGSGVFLPPPSSSSTTPAPVTARSQNIPLEDGGIGSGGAGGVLQELDRQLDAIAISADCMDDDVALALFGDYDEGGFEEILDDFCFTAGQDSLIEEQQQPDGGGGGAAGVGGDDDKRVTSASNPDFDFDKHVQMLIERAKREDNGGEKVVPQKHEWWQKQENEFSRATPHHLTAKHDEYDGTNDDESQDSWDQEYDDDDVNKVLGEMSLVDPATTSHHQPKKLSTEEEKVLNDKFNATLLEYDSDEVGDLDPQYKEIVGEKPLEGDVYVDTAFTQFLQSMKDGVFMEGTASQAENRRTGGSSHVLVGTKRFDPSSAEVEEAARIEEEEKLEMVLQRADETLAMGEDDLPPEEVLIDGKSYFTMKERNPWDCESILSTYSNLDNNPAVIGSSGSRRRGKRNKKKSQSGEGDSVSEGQPLQIRLSNKTGLPLDVQEEGDGGDEDEDDDGFYEDNTFVSVNKGIARRKGETKEEKRARKKGVKEEREISRLQKKIMREAIENEFRKHAGNAAADDVAGKSVFRF